MKRLILFLLIAGICTAFAPWHGNVQLSQCGNYIDGNHVGDTICPNSAAPNNRLFYFDGVTVQWQFDGTTAGCSNFPAGNGHLSTYFATNFVSPCAAKVERCGAAGNTPQGAYTEFIAPSTYIVLTFPSIVLGTGLCSPVYDAFQDSSNRARDGNTAQESNDNALAGDILDWQAVPGGNVPDWAFMAAAQITQANLTINCHAPWKATGAVAPQPPGHGSMIVNAPGVTINNCEWDGPLGDATELLQLEDNQTSIVVNGVTLRNNYGTQGGHGFLTAGSTVNDTGEVDLFNSLIDNNGDCNTDGQYHNVYIGVSLSGGAHHRFSMQGTTATRSGCGGEGLKSKAHISDIGTTTTNIIAQLGTGTHGGSGGSGNGGGHLINFPYGGVVTVSNNVLEQGPFTSNSDALGFGLDLCHDGYTGITTHSVLYSNDWIIIDTISSPTPSLNPAIIFHTAARGPDCVTQFAPVTTVSNTTIVINNPNSFGVLVNSCGGIACLGGMFVDGGGNDLYCGSTHYTSPLTFNATLACTGGDGSGRIAAGLPPFSDSLASLPSTPPH